MYISVLIIVESTHAVSEVRRPYTVNRVPLLSSAERVKCLWKIVCGASDENDTRCYEMKPVALFNCPSKQIDFIFCQLVAT